MSSLSILIVENTNHKLRTTTLLSLDLSLLAHLTIRKQRHVGGTFTTLDQIPFKQTSFFSVEFPVWKERIKTGSVRRSLFGLPMGFYGGEGFTSQCVCPGFKCVFVELLLDRVSLLSKRLLTSNTLPVSRVIFQYIEADWKFTHRGQLLNFSFGSHCLFPSLKDRPLGCELSLMWEELLLLIKRTYGFALSFCLNHLVVPKEDRWLVKSTLLPLQKHTLGFLA